MDIENCDVTTSSSVLLSDPSVNLEKQVQETVHNIAGKMKQLM